MYSIRPLSLADYDALIELMRTTPGVTLRDADSREATGRYLERNPGLSFVAEIDAHIVGCLMSGHDGRRGYLQHLVVGAEHRRQGIATALVERCLAALAEVGIHKCHLDVLQTNQSGAAFWEKRGWQLRTDIRRYSFIHSGSANA